MIYPHPAIQLLDLLPVLFGRFITEKDANQRPFDSKIQWFRSLGEQQASPFILPPSNQSSSQRTAAENGFVDGAGSMHPAPRSQGCQR